LVNLGLFRTRLDGYLYSRGKYITTFDAGDIYEDNYVLTDTYNILEKYNLDFTQEELQEEIDNLISNGSITYSVGHYTCLL